MIHANELMIGDYVLYQGNPNRVYRNLPDTVPFADAGRMKEDLVHIVWNDVHDQVNVNNIDPIPLTAEILEKNGFEIVSARDDNAGTMEKYFYPRIGYVYRFSNGEWEVELIGYGRGFSGAAKYRGVIKYVHELQHVFRILKLEKEIEL